MDRLPKHPQTYYSSPLQRQWGSGWQPISKQSVLIIAKSLQKSWVKFLFFLDALENIESPQEKPLYLEVTSISGSRALAVKCLHYRHTWFSLSHSSFCLNILYSCLQAASWLVSGKYQGHAYVLVMETPTMMQKASSLILILMYVK